MVKTMDAYISRTLLNLDQSEVVHELRGEISCTELRMAGPQSDTLIASDHSMRRGSLAVDAG